MASEVSSGTANYQGGEKKTWLELPPGFRFHPTDEDLVRHYLSKKVLSRFSSLVDVDLNKCEPWDLPSKANMGEQEWYFFSFRDRKYPTTGMRTNRATASGYWAATGKDTEIFRANYQGGKKKTLVVHAGPRALIEHQTGADVSTGDMRFSASDVLHNKMPRRATRSELLQGMASALECLHSSLDRPIRFRDLKPSNVLLDEKTENQLSDDYTHIHIPRGRAVPTHNGPLDAKFSGKPSAERGIEIKIGSHMTRQRTYLSVHHHPLLQIFKGWISAKPTYESFGDIFKGWISGKPKYETPNAGQVSEYIIRKLCGIENGLTVNGSQQNSEPDSCQSGHGKTAVNTKPSSASSWIIATAAPHHATGNRNLLSGFIMEHDDQFVHAVNRVPMKVLARGAVVTDAFILPDVWFVPGLTENLVSVSQLAELDHSIGFGRGECCIRSASDAKIVGKGHLQQGGHYVLDYLKVPLAI